MIEPAYTIKDDDLRCLLFSVVTCTSTMDDYVMPPDQILLVKVIHEEAIFSIGVLAVLRDYEDLKVQISTLSDMLVEQGSARCDLVIADHGSALHLANSRKVRLQKTHHEPRILVLTSQNREWDLRVAIAAGVNGYVTKDVTPDELVTAVKAVTAGIRYVSTALVHKLADSLTRDVLTAREMQVLMVMSTGASNKTMAAKLRIAETTVKAHIRSILRKTGACSRTEAVALANQRGLYTTHDHLMR